MPGATVIKQHGNNATMAAVARLLGAGLHVWSPKQDGICQQSSEARVAALVGRLRDPGPREGEKSSARRGEVAAGPGRDAVDTPQALASHREETWPALRYRDPLVGACGLDRAIRLGWILF